jgi:hypothetical protein
MSIADRIYETVKALPESSACKVLDFAESLKAKQSEGDRVGNEKSKLITKFAGVLAKSPSFQGDPLEIQKSIRNEWN